MKAPRASAALRADNMQIEAPKLHSYHCLRFIRNKYAHITQLTEDEVPFVGEGDSNFSDIFLRCFPFLNSAHLQSKAYRGDI